MNLSHIFETVGHKECVNMLKFVEGHRIFCSIFYTVSSPVLLDFNILANSFIIPITCPPLVSILWVKQNQLSIKFISIKYIIIEYNTVPVTVSHHAWRVPFDANVPRLTPYLTSGYCFMIANFYSHDRSNNRIFISVSLSGTLAHSLCMLKKKCEWENIKLNMNRQNITWLLVYSRHAQKVQ